MDKAQFWRLIEDAKAETGGDCEEQVDTLRQSLARLTLQEIIAFEGIYDEFRFLAYRWDLWGASVFISGGSHDGFEYFRGWLIAQGESVYKNALEDPDGLADVVPDGFYDAECEDMLYVAAQAYEDKTGTEMPERQKAWPKIVGQKWDDAELDTLYPRLAAKVAQSKAEEL